MDDAIRVLHVDDDPDFIDLAATFLKRESDRFEIESATDGIEGLDRFTNLDLDCIISDYELPELDGVGFLERVREVSDDLPFILYTGKGSEAIAAKAISAGVTDYIQKESGTSQYKLLANRVLNAVDQYRTISENRELKKKLTFIAEKTDDILFLVNSEWTELQFVNSAYETVWNGSVEELERDPRSFLDAIHPEDVERVTEIFERVLSGEPTEVEYRIVTDDGNVRWMYSEGKPVFENGEFTRIVGIVRDITDQKVREQKLKGEV